MARKPQPFKSLFAAVFFLLACKVTAESCYFPLKEGNYWKYRTTFPKAPVQLTVTGYEDGIATLESDGHEVKLRRQGPEVHLKLPGEGFVLFYNFTSGSSWIHRDWDPCSDGLQATVLRENEPVVTPAGTFRDCLHIRYRGSVCADAGKTDQWWASGVGLVKWYQSNITGRVTGELLTYSTGRSPRREVQFIRGGANANGELDIADAVYTLSYLFVDGPPPPCFDAADANDDGEVDLADAVAVLGHLFAGTGDLPPPFPACGSDPTEDPLGCDEFPPCEENPCLEQIEAIAEESGFVGSCSAVVRLEHNTRRLLGWQLICGPYAQVTGEKARHQAEADTGYGSDARLLSSKKPADCFVFYLPAGDFGGASVVSARTGLSLFGGSIVWMGTGHITYPKSWRPVETLGTGCPPFPSRPEAKGYDLVNGGRLSAEDVKSALDVVWQTALPEGLATSGYLFDAVVLRYPRSVGVFNPDTAEWVVILNAGWLE